MKKMKFFGLMAIAAGLAVLPAVVLAQEAGAASGGTSGGEQTITNITVNNTGSTDTSNPLPPPPVSGGEGMPADGRPGFVPGRPIPPPPVNGEGGEMRNFGDRQVDGSNKQMPPPGNRDMRGVREIKDNKNIPNPPKEKMNFDEEENDKRDFVDPQQINDALRQIKEVRKEAGHLIKRADKITTPNEQVTKAKASLTTLLESLTKFESNIKAMGEDGDRDRDVMQDFWDANVWDVAQEARMAIELPNELKKVEAELKQLKKTLGAKNFALEGVSLEVINTTVAEIEKAAAAARAAMEANDSRTAQNEMQTIWDSAHPGDINGFVKQMQEISKNLKKVKSAEIKTSIMDILSPVFESANNGDFREANNALNQIKKELMPLLNKVQKQSKPSSDTMQKIKALENKLDDKSNSSNHQSLAPYYYLNQKASIVDVFLGWFGW